MKKAKKLHVFLNNKTVSLDTILPFLADLKLASPSIKIIFFVFNKKTYEDIKANELLFELVCEFGKIEHFSLFANWAVCAVDRICCDGDPDCFESNDRTEPEFEIHAKSVLSWHGTLLCQC